MEAQRTFTRFPDLPKELQLEIWEHAAVPEPRAVKFTLTTAQNVRNDEKNPIRSHFKLLTPGPAILYANSDSRRIGLRVYNTFAFNIQEGDGVNRDLFYSNPMIDSLQFYMPDLGNNWFIHDFLPDMQARPQGPFGIHGNTHVFMSVILFRGRDQAGNALSPHHVFVVEAQRNMPGANNYTLDASYQQGRMVFGPGEMVGVAGTWFGDQFPIWAFQWQNIVDTVMGVVIPLFVL